MEAATFCWALRNFYILDFLRLPISKVVAKFHHMQISEQVEIMAAKKVGEGTSSARPDSKLWQFMF